MDALLGFLGSTASFADTSSEYRKQYDGSLRDAFANWDELEATMPRLTPLDEPPDPRPAARRRTASRAEPGGRTRRRGPAPASQGSLDDDEETGRLPDDGAGRGRLPPIWHRYYAGLFGAENLYVVDHNSVGKRPAAVLGADLNRFRIPFDTPSGTAADDRPPSTANGSASCRACRARC